MARRVALQEAVTARRNAFPGEDSWALRLWLELARTDGGEEEPWRCLVRAVGPGDAAALVQFGTEGLSDASRASFAPYELLLSLPLLRLISPYKTYEILRRRYDWSSPRLADDFDAAIAKSTSKADLHLVAVSLSLSRARALALSLSRSLSLSDCGCRSMRGWSSHTPFSGRRRTTCLVCRALLPHIHVLMKI